MIDSVVSTALGSAMVFNSPMATAWTGLILATGILRLWYAVPLITSVSLVFAATRHEEMGPILIHALRFAIWIVIFMAVVWVGIQVMGWFL